MGDDDGGYGGDSEEEFGEDESRHSDSTHPQPYDGIEEEEVDDDDEGALGPFVDTALGPKRVSALEFSRSAMDEEQESAVAGSAEDHALGTDDSPPEEEMQEETAGVKGSIQDELLFGFDDTDDEGAVPGPNFSKPVNMKCVDISSSGASILADFPECTSDFRVLRSKFIQININPNMDDAVHQGSFRLQLPWHFIESLEILKVLEDFGEQATQEEVEGAKTTEPTDAEVDDWGDDEDEIDLFSEV